MIEGLTGEEMFGAGYEAYKEQQAKMEAGVFDFDEEYRAKFRDMFKEFQVKPSKKEQKDIRKIFLNLSKKFHPDVAENEEQTDEFHSIMQQINEAYQSNDIQMLLEIEQLYSTKSIDFESEVVTVTILEKEIERLEKAINFIKNQITRTSAEIKNLRKSSFGEMLTSFDRAEAAGEGLSAMNEHYEQMIDLFTAIKEGFKDSLDRQEISPILVKMMMDNPMMADDIYDDTEEEVIDILEKLIAGDGDTIEIMNDFYENEVQVSNPEFPVDSSVRVKRNVPHPYFEEVNIRGWQGRVQEATYDDDKKIIYEIDLDSITMLQIPQEIIQDLVDNDGDFQAIEVEASQLEACPPRDTEENSFAIFRTLNHRYYWNFLQNKPQQKRLKKILLKEPELSDSDNWAIYFKEQLTFPFKAKVKGRYELKKGTVVKVLNIGFYDQEDGFVVTIKHDKNKDIYVLSDLKVIDKKSKNHEVLQDYNIWVDKFLRWDGEDEEGFDLFF